jgi:hypothetical protein
MTNEPEHSKRLLQDDQMDQLLTAFYSSERPSRLDQLPSSWPQLQAAGTAQETVAVRVVAEQHRGHKRPTTARRGLAVAASTLALCLMLMMFSSQPVSTTGNGTAGSPGTPAGQTEALPGTEDATFSVSGGERNGAVDDHNTSLKEIDEIDLNPAPQPVQK